MRGAFHRGFLRAKQARLRRCGPRRVASVITALVLLVAGLAPSATVAATCTTRTTDLKLLVLAGDGKESDLAAIKQALDGLGTPYTLWIASQRPGQLTSAQLLSGCHGFFQGVILTTDSLSYRDVQGTLISTGLTSTEWQALDAYETGFLARQLTWFARPAAASGFNRVSKTLNTSTSPITTQLTTAGHQVFTYAQPSANIPIKGVTTYLATPLQDGTTTPLLVDAQGNALALVRNLTGGRELLSLTFNSNPTLIQDLVLWYGLVNWVTRGLFLGEFHTYLTPHIDDMFQGNGEWAVGATCTTATGTGLAYRMTGADFDALLNWQQSRQKANVSHQLTLNLAYIGNGTVLYVPDTLTPAATANAHQFHWINHTYAHPHFDNVDYSYALSQIQKDIALSTKLNLTPFSIRNLVTPAITGLANPAALQAAYDSGVRFVATYAEDHPGQGNPSPNAGVWLTGGFNGKTYRILGIPRHRTNLYSNVSTPQEWLAHDNCVHPLGDSAYVADYAGILKRESAVVLRYMLRGDLDPLEFHQINARAYDGTHSMLTDLLSSALDQYRQLVTLPLASPTMDDLGARMTARMAYDSARPGLTATVTTSSSGRVLRLSSTSAIVVPVTGLATNNAESYAGQHISHINLKSGGSVSIPLP
jgi:hypothetical protein